MRVRAARTRRAVLAEQSRRVDLLKTNPGRGPAADLPTVAGDDARRPARAIELTGMSGGAASRACSPVAIRRSTAAAAGQRRVERRRW